MSDYEDETYDDGDIPEEVEDENDDDEDDGDEDGGKFNLNFCISKFAFIYTIFGFQDNGAGVGDDDDDDDDDGDNGRWSFCPRRISCEFTFVTIFVFCPCVSRLLRWGRR